MFISLSVYFGDSTIAFKNYYKFIVYFNICIIFFSIDAVFSNLHENPKLRFNNVLILLHKNIFVLISLGWSLIASCFVTGGCVTG